MGVNCVHWQAMIVLVSTMLQLCISHVVFYDKFDKDLEDKWIKADKENYQDGWKHAKKYEIVRELNKPFSLKSGTVVLQFEIRLGKGLECGAAYFKCLTHQEDGSELEEFGNESLYYSIMFGLEICGSANKVDFVLNHKNPKSGKYVQHHLKSPPPVPSDELSHVYTAVLKPNKDLVILIDGKHKKLANFLNGNDFDPPIVPVKTISGPNDKKPDAWDERPKVKTGNSAYREKWHARLDDNPHYNGTWKAKEILNPDYYELDRLEYRPISATGIEIWKTGDIGIWLDDIVIATSQEDAETYREKRWKAKFEADKENRKAKESPACEGKLHPFLGKLLDLIAKCNYKMNVTRGQHGTNIVSLTISCGVFCCSIFYEF